MTTLLRRASLRRVIAAAAAASSFHPEVQPSLSLLYLSFLMAGLGWRLAILGRMLDAFSGVFYYAD